ncbi:jg22405 [Pararge aegeria aegeria]|uniref:Jg22405 protein n=1 Tax=Pararge aegeria aegeria TaxID=348720 RepID=A0A8S4QZL0_9NEOP|nr:jg22405 [Pararge aegeria aegeria]
MIRKCIGRTLAMLKDEIREDSRYHNKVKKRRSTTRRIMRSSKGQDRQITGFHCSQKFLAAIIIFESYFQTSLVLAALGSLGVERSSRRNGNHRHILNGRRDSVQLGHSRDAMPFPTGVKHHNGPVPGPTPRHTKSLSSRKECRVATFNKEFRDGYPGALQVSLSRPNCIPE